MYEVNSLDFENVDIEVLNEYYLRRCTMNLHISCIRSVIMTHRLIALPKENMLVPTGISVAENGNSYLREDADAWPKDL